MLYAVYYKIFTEIFDQAKCNVRKVLITHPGPFAFWHGRIVFSHFLSFRPAQLWGYSPYIRLYCFYVPRTKIRHTSVCHHLHRLSAQYPGASPVLTGLMGHC